MPAYTSKIPIQKINDALSKFPFIKVDDDGDIDIYFAGNYNREYNGNVDDGLELMEAINTIFNHPDLKDFYDTHLDHWVESGYYGGFEGVYITFRQKS